MHVGDLDKDKIVIIAQSIPIVKKIMIINNKDQTKELKNE